MARTRVSLLDYPLDGTRPVTTTDFTNSEALDQHIKGLEGKDTSSVKLRLYVVEDLSREVIETLGSHYDVDPSFFREHLVDYVWYNISKSSCAIGKKRSVNVFVQRTGGGKHQIWISCLEVRIGSRCVSHGPDISRTRMHLKMLNARHLISTSIVNFKETLTTANSGTPTRTRMARKRRQKWVVFGAGQRSG